MKEENYASAVECYTKAIDLDLRNAVYYCNRCESAVTAELRAPLGARWGLSASCTPLLCNLCRAAAHSKLGNYTEATVDCERAIRIDPAYSKAYGRMG